MYIQTPEVIDKCAKWLRSATLCVVYLARMSLLLGASIQYSDLITVFGFLGKPLLLFISEGLLSLCVTVACVSVTNLLSKH